MIVAVGEILLPAAHDGRQVLEIVRNGPVQRDVAERRLRAPAARRVHAVDEALHALLDFLLRQVVHPDKRRKVGVKAGKRLGPRPLVLHDAQEVHHLVAQRGQVAGGRGRDLTRHAAQALLDQLLQAPARAVAGQHRQVVQVDRRAAVRLGNLLVVHLAEPVVRRDRARIGQDQAPHRVRNRRVLLDPPGVDLQVVVHQVLVVQQRRVDVAHLLPLLAVQDVRLRHVRVPRLRQHLLHAVLDVLHGDLPVAYLILKVRRHVQRQQLDHAGMVLPLGRVERLCDGPRNLRYRKIDVLAVTLDYFVHLKIPLGG